jgi:hypothetical protein
MIERPGVRPLSSVSKLSSALPVINSSSKSSLQTAVGTHGWNWYQVSCALHAGHLKRGIAVSCMFRTCCIAHQQVSLIYVMFTGMTSSDELVLHAENCDCSVYISENCVLGCGCLAEYKSVTLATVWSTFTI